MTRAVAFHWGTDRVRACAVKARAFWSRATWRDVLLWSVPVTDVFVAISYFREPMNVAAMIWALVAAFTYVLVCVQYDIIRSGSEIINRQQALIENQNIMLKPPDGDEQAMSVSVPRSALPMAPMALRALADQIERQLLPDDDANLPVM